MGRPVSMGFDVGKIVWPDDIAVEGVVEGFFAALGSKPPIKSIPLPIDACFQYYLASQYTEEDIRLI